MTDDRDRKALNRLDCEAPPANDEASHFINCPHCGQAFDCRQLGDVVHHLEPGHDPLPTQ